MENIDREKMSENKVSVIKPVTIVTLIISIEQAP